MFMDALCSSATTAKGNPKKRKRRTSSSKDGSPPPLDSPKIIAGPMKFYQDTQEEAADDKDEASPSKKLSVDVKEEDDEENSPSSPSKGDTSMDQDGTVTKESNDKDETTVAGNPESPVGDPEAAVAVEEEMDVEEDNTPKPPGPGCGPDGPPGVLVIHRRKSAKKSVRWRPQEQLEEVRLFELDETERVNVTKTFTDMKQIERYGERDAFQMARKLQADDVMVEQTPWTHLIEVDDVPVSPHGNQSKERDIQAARELTCLQALYFSYAMIPDSASEPEMETIKYAEPAVIPLEDAQNTVNDFTKQGWPEPREAHGGINSFNGPPSFDPSAFGGAAGPFSMPPFGVPNQGIWNGGPPFGGGPPPTQYGGAMSNEEIKLAMNRLAFPGQNFNPPNFNGINMMNLPAMGAGGPSGGPPPGGWGFRGPPPNGIGGVWRGHGPPPGPPGAGPRAWVNNNMAANGGRLCKNFKKGFCKKGDKCNFLHPSGNGPPGGFNRI